MRNVIRQPYPIAYNGLLKHTTPVSISFIHQEKVMLAGLWFWLYIPFKKEYDR